MGTRLPLPSSERSIPSGCNDGGGALEGLVGFAVGEIGVTEQTLRGMPLRVAIGTNHLIITGSATAAALIHLTVVLPAKLTSRGIWWL